MRTSSGHTSTMESYLRSLGRHFGTEPTPGKMEHYRGLGIEEVVFNVPSGTADEILPILDGYARYLTGE